MVYMDDKINWLVERFMVMFSHCGHFVWSSQRHYDGIHDNLKMHCLLSLRVVVVVVVMASKELLLDLRIRALRNALFLPRET
jgi:hypothetical protein